jgi:hypothetical protein
LKEKEELGEGLHLIDFEQLKIENQTYNEKIEERNEVSRDTKRENERFTIIKHLGIDEIEKENKQYRSNINSC